MLDLKTKKAPGRLGNFNDLRKDECVRANWN